jgi:NAD+ diphosphatase
MSQPHEVHIPYNQAIIRDDFRPGTPDRDRPEAPGFWLILREGGLVMRQNGHGPVLPHGPAPVPGPFAVPPVYLGEWQESPLRAARLIPEASVPAPLAVIPAGYRSPVLDDRLLTLAGLARQVLHWRDRSRICPACGGLPREIPGNWGMRCPACSREYYPRLHPAVIVLITRGEEFLLVRKPEWPAGQFGLVAGYLEFAESLEECVAREVKEETNLTLTDIRYLESQNWPFPSQIMAGFTARYAGGDLALDRTELEDAGWFSADRLPPLLPPRSSIARRLLDRYAPGCETWRGRP